MLMPLQSFLVLYYVLRGTFPVTDAKYQEYLEDGDQAELWEQLREERVGIHKEIEEKTMTEGGIFEGWDLRKEVFWWEPYHFHQFWSVREMSVTFSRRPSV